MRQRSLSSRRAARGQPKRMKIVRGYISRKPKSTTKARRRKIAGHHQLDKYLAQLDYYKASQKARPQWLDDGFSTWCAVQIQTLWRMQRISQRYQRSRMMIYQIAALTIQNSWKCFQYNSERSGMYHQSAIARNISTPEDDALSALIIQACWRSFCSRRIFKYFSDLIRLKLKGAPADLLRSIVPNESSFLDFASGTHVRFRLGGHAFPPSIYFKIYTHRPLCDINSFAPRDYSQEKKPEIRSQSSIDHPPLSGKWKTGSSKSLSKEKGIRVGSKYFGALVTTTVGMDQWYKREENNPWRPIASQIMSELMTPPWSRDEVSKPQVKKVSAFHFSRLRRQVDIDAEKKRRKREWMLKAHRMATGDEADQRPESKDEGDDNYEYETKEGYGTNQYGLDCRRDSSRAEDKSYSDRHESKGDVKRRSSPDRKHGEEPSEAKPHSAHPNSKYMGEVDGKNQENEENEYYYYNNPYRASNAPSDVLSSKQDGLADDSDLLKWSLALDFNEYSDSWQTMATSLPSDLKRPPARTLDLGSY